MGRGREGYGSQAARGTRSWHSSAGIPAAPTANRLASQKCALTEGKLHHFVFDDISLNLYACSGFTGRPHQLVSCSHCHRAKHHPRHRGYNYKRRNRYSHPQQVVNCPKFWAWAEHHDFMEYTWEFEEVVTALGDGCSMYQALQVVCVWAY